MSNAAKLLFRSIVLLLLVMLQLWGAFLLENLQTKLTFDETGASPRLLRDIASVEAAFPGGAGFLMLLPTFLPALIVQAARLFSSDFKSELWLILSALFALATGCMLASAHAILGRPYLLTSRLDVTPHEWSVLVSTSAWILLECLAARRRGAKPEGATQRAP